MTYKDSDKDIREFNQRFLEALAFRNHENKSLAELREIFHVSRTMIHGWRTGTKAASKRSALTISKELDVSYEWLLTGEGNIEGFQLQTPEEVIMMERYRNLTKVGRRKVMSFIYDECQNNEKEPTLPEEKQKSLKLIRDA